MLQSTWLVFLSRLLAERAKLILRLAFVSSQIFERLLAFLLNCSFDFVISGREFHLERMWPPI